MAEHTSASMLGRATCAVTTTFALILGGCSASTKQDPTAVVRTNSIASIQDNTRSDDYRVTSAKLTQTGLGVTLTLGFSISNANGTQFSPSGTVRYPGGELITCEVDDLRRTPSLRRTTTSWDFKCDTSTIPESAEGATITVVDKYN